MPDEIFILRTKINSQDLDLPQVDEILLLRTRNWTGKEGYLFYNVVNEKEMGKAISPQFNILETELICQVLSQK
jgi:hypothetical protein